MEKIFNTVVIKKDSVVLDGIECEAKIAKHSIWIPAMKMKFPFQWCGRFVEYRDMEKGQHYDKIKTYDWGVEDWSGEDLDPVYDSLRSIAEEYLMFEALSWQKFSPKVYDFFYIKNVISDFLYKSSHCDPMGAVGFFMEDANVLPEKKFDRKHFELTFIETGVIKASKSALNDICMKERNNHVNGYMIDLRRSVQDAVHLSKEYDNEIIELTHYIWERIKMTKEELKTKIKKLTQFPHKERKQQYQSYWIGDEYEKGSRDINYRLDMFNIPFDLSKMIGVVDLGCQLGSVAQACYKRGARKVTGIELTF